MKIVCPSCTATYDVPDAVVAAKRAVRCARCGNNWVPADDATARQAGAPDAPTVAPEITPAPPEFEQPTPSVQAETGASPALSSEPEVESPAPAPPDAVAQVVERPLPPPRNASIPPAAAPPKSTPVTKDVAPLQTAPVAGWIASIALLLIMALSGVVFRAGIMKSWPPSERLYAVVGLYRP